MISFLLFVLTVVAIVALISVMYATNKDSINDFIRGHNSKSDYEQEEMPKSYMKDDDEIENVVCSNCGGNKSKSLGNYRYHCEYCDTDFTVEHNDVPQEKELKAKCLYCGEKIEVGVSKCPHCGEWLVRRPDSPQQPHPSKLL